MLVYPQIVTGDDLLRGIIKIDELAPLLQRRGAHSVAIVNEKLYGARPFFETMKAHGIHPVLGLTIRLAISKETEVKLYGYAKDDQGFRNLLKISSAMAVQQEKNLPIRWLEAYRGGCLFVCPLTDKSWEGKREVSIMQQLLDACEMNSVSIGISRPGGKLHEEEQRMEALANELEIPIVACYEATYLQKEDYFAYEVATAIRKGQLLSDPTRKKPSPFGYVPEEVELTDWFSDRLDWLSASSTLLAACTATIPPKEVLMPKFPVAPGETAAGRLKQNCFQGLQNRFGILDEAYTKRLTYELSIIESMGFSDYFLIVEDFIRFAKENHILTGPGRGSSAGSLVAFALGITNVDPLRYNLIFERFLNPGRITLPDIDVDFADDRRDEVIQYVAKKYGKAHVAQIITFGTLSAKSVVRNVGRVFGFTTEELSFVSNELAATHEEMLSAAVGASQSLQRWIEMDELRKKWIQVSLTLEGLPRNASTHAAGVILSPKPLVESIPLQLGGDDMYLTQWPMGDVEAQGLLKMDFLGLRNLSLLDRIRQLIYFDRNKWLQFDHIPLHDEKTFQLFQRGDTTGIFQFESSGMRDALRLIRPTTFEDLYAINALYRPGPMEHIPLYGRRKNEGEEIVYLAPSLQPILQETYGVIVYQEQIMQIAVTIAGYTFAEADLLRRAISKKNKDVIEKEQHHFVQKAKQQGVTEQTAMAVYDLIAKFASYGFPKSHAVAYSMIAYQLAYLKANEPAYFYAALLSSTTGNRDKIMEIIREAEARQIHILPPSIVDSKYIHTVENGKIRLGISAIKGVSPTFYQAVKKQRKQGKRWKTLFDMAAALGGEYFTEKNVQPLIKAGALDVFEQPRNVLLASVDAARTHALFIQPDGDGDLLQDVIHQVASPKYSPGGTLTQMQLLEFEREVLGFYLSEHPTVSVKKAFHQPIQSIYSLHGQKSSTSVRVIGLILSVKRIRTKKGEAMAFVTIQDETGEIDCTYFPKQYAIANADLIEMNMIIIEGRLDYRNRKSQIIVNESKVLPLGKLIENKKDVPLS